MSTCFLCFTEADLKDVKHPAMTFGPMIPELDPRVGGDPRISGGFMVHKDCFLNDEEFGSWIPVSYSTYLRRLIRRRFRALAARLFVDPDRAPRR